MAAVVAGSGYGLFNASNNILGLNLSGRMGQDVLGRAANYISVNAVTGNLLVQAQDVYLSGRGADLFDLRTYNSQGAIGSRVGDELGAGWLRDGEVRLSFSGTQAGVDGTVTRRLGDGSVQTFTWNAARGLYTSDDGAGAQDTMTFDSSTKQWTYIEGTSRAKEVYEQPGNAPANVWRLKSRADVSGNTITYQYETVDYDSLWRITDIVDSSGQKIHFTYNTAHRITGVSVVQLTLDASGHATGTATLSTVTYGYDAQGRIQTVTTDLTPDNTTDSKVFTTTYTYVTDPALDSRLLASIAQSDGTTQSFDYYTSGPNLGKVWHVTDGAGATASVQTFTYGNGQTTVTQPDGQQWTYTYDGQQQLIMLEAPATTAGGARPTTRYFYDAHGNVFKIIDAAGTVVIYQYDERGNVLVQRDSLGNTISRTYDPATNQLLGETRYTTPDAAGLDDNTIGIGSANGAQTTRYIYDSQARVRFVISPEGRVTENRYESGGYGLLTRTIVYAAGRFDASTLGASGQEAQLAAWASDQDQTQTELTQYTYDSRGNLATKTSFAAVSTSGVGTPESSSVLHYVYDGYGALLQTIAMRGANRDIPAILTSMGYDGLGRETTRVNSSGTTNTYYDDAHGAIQITNTSSKLRQTRTFDNAGRLTSAVLSDTTAGSTTPSRKTEYLYDAGSRLQVVQTIAGVDGAGKEIVGARTFSFYDADGRLEYAVDATGAVTRFTYDGVGRILTQISYANRAATAAWVSGSKTTFTVGTDVLIDAAHDRTIVNTYDAAGRHATTTDGEGTVTTTHYDGAGRVTSVQVGTPSAGYRTTQYFYDADGNQVGVLDPLGYLTERKYDAANRLVETVRYSNKSATAGDPSTPVWNGVTNQTANVGRLFVYHLPAAYDADGDAIAYTVVGASSWLTFDAATLTVSGKPPQGATSGYITIKAADGSAKSQDVTVNVTIVNAPPDWSNIPDATVALGTAGFSIALPDAADIETPSAQLTYSVSQIPPGMSFNGKTLSGTPTIAGTYVITATVTDAGSPALSTRRSFTVFVTNQGPRWTPDLSALPHARRNAAFDYTLPAAVDPEHQAMTYRLVSGPSWLSLSNPATPRLTGTPTAAATDGTPIVVEAKDESGAITYLAFSLIVEGLPPDWNGNFSVSAPAGRIADVALPPASDPDGTPVHYELTGDIPPALLAAGLSVDRTTGRVTTSRATPPDVTTYSFTVRATDGEGKSTDRTVTLRLTNSPPEYVGGLAANYDDWQFNPKTVLIFYSDFKDLNGPFTLSVDGATPGLLPFAFPDPNHTTWVPGLYFEPNYNIGPEFGHISHGSLDRTIDQDTGERPMGVLTYYNPFLAAGTVIPITVRATEIGQEGLSVVKTFTITIKEQEGQAPLPPPPPPPPPGPPRPPGSPPISPPVIAPGGGDGLPEIETPPITSPPPPVLVDVDPSPPPSDDLPPPPPPSYGRGLPPRIDVLANIRPANTEGLHTYLYYDDENRVIGSVDDRGFFTQTIYDDGANTQSTLKYQDYVSVSDTDTVASLAGRAGAHDTSTIVYDGFGRVSTSTAFDQTKTRYEYDEAGRVSRRIVADGTSVQRATRARYDVFDDVIGVVSGEGEATLIGTPTADQIDAAITAYGVRSVYDSVGRKIRSTDANNHSTYFYYDTGDRLRYLVNAAGEVSETRYDAFGDVDSTLRYGNRLTGTLTGGADSLLQVPTANAAQDQLTSYTYDRRGLMLQTKRPVGGFVTTNTYTAFGELETQTRAISTGVATTTRFAYDLDGQVVLQTADFGGINSNSQTYHDAYGRVIRSVDGAGNAIVTRYLDSGRAIEVTDPLDRTVRDVYDAYGRVHYHTDASGQVTTFTYDQTARTSIVRTPEGIEVTTTRNEFGEIVSVKDGRGNTTSYTYDKNGNLKTSTDPSQKTVTRYYDPSGRLDHTVDARGTVTQLYYDAVDRVLTRVIDPSGLNIRSTFEYDAFGRVQTLTEGTRITAYSYDQEDRLTQILVDPSGLKLSTTFGYDALGDTIRVARGGGSTPDRQITVYSFDKLGRRLAEVLAPSAEPALGTGSPSNRDIATKYVYDSSGRVTRKIDPNGQSTWYVYDAAGELRYTIDALGDVNETIYDANGRVSQTRRYATRIAASTVATFGDSLTSFTPPATSSADARTYLVYDLDGRERFVLQAVSGEGAGKWAVSENRYDQNDNLIESRRYDQFLTTAQIAANDTAGSPGLSVAEVSSALVSLGYQDTALGAGSTDESTLRAIDRQRFAYDLNDRLRFSVNAVGAVSERVYDENGNVIRTVAYAGVPTLTSYTESAIGAAVDRTNPSNRIVQLAYDRAGRAVYTIRVLAVDGTGKATKQLIAHQSYDALGNVTLVREYAGTFGALADYTVATLDLTVNGTYVDGAVASKDARNRTTVFTYDRVGQQVYSARVLAVDANGVATKHLVTKTTHDELGRVVETTQYATAFDSLADYSLATLDSAALAHAADSQNRTNAVVYDAVGRVAYGIQVLAVDSAGKSTQQLVTRNGYDAAGHLVQTTLYARQMQLADYRLATLDLAVVSNVSEQDRSSTFVYDAVGQQIYTIDSLGPDANGVAQQRVARATYDALGRVTLMTAYAAKFKLTDLSAGALDAAVAAASVANDPSNRLTAYAYNAASEQIYTVRVAQIDGNGAPTRQFITQTCFDALGRVIKTIAYADSISPANYAAATLDAAVAASSVKGNPLNRITAFAYDAAGDQIYSVRVKTVDGTGTPTEQLIVKQTFNAFGEVVLTRAYASTTIPLTDYRKQTIDAALVNSGADSNVENRTSAAAYDTLGRQIYSARVLAVDASGVATQHAVTKRVYDAFDQVTQTTAFATPMPLASYTLATLDAATAAGTSAQDRTTRHVFDTAGRERFVVDADGSLTEKVFDGVGQLTELRRFSTRFTFDPAKADLESYWSGLRGSAYVGDLSTRGMKYEYDPAGRLTKTTDALNHAEVSVYDGAGNRTKLTDKNGGVWTYTYDALGQIQSQLSPSVSVVLASGSAFSGGLQTAYGYDAFGDMTSQTEAANTADARKTTYTYDNLGQLQTVTLPGWYDPSGGKVVKVADGTTPPAGSFQRTVERLYDAFGDTVRIRTNSSVSTYVTQYQAFDTLGRLAFDVDALNNVTGYGYDTFGEQTVVTRYVRKVPAAPTPANATYWVPAEIAKAVAGDPDARTITTTYDLLGRKHQVTGQASSNYYAGSTGLTTNASSVTAPPGGTPIPTTTYDFNVFGELVRESTQIDPGVHNAIVPDGPWLGETSFGAPAVATGTMASVASETNADGRVVVFATNSIGMVFQRYQLTPGGAWSAWTSLDLGAGYSRLTVARNQDGRLELFGTDSSGHIVHRTQTSAGSSGWSAWSVLDGTVVTSLAAETNADGRVEIFFTNSSGQIFHRWQLTPGGAWSTISQFDGALNNVAVARNQDGRLELFGKNSAGQVFHRWQVAAGGWSAWEFMPTDFVASSVAAETNADGRIELIAVANTGQVMHRWQTVPNTTSSPGTWSSWTAFGGTNVSKIAIARNQDGRLELFGLTSAGTMIERSQALVDTGKKRETFHYYDLMGNETLTVDANRYQTARKYDALGNLTRVIESAQAGQAGTLTAPPPVLAAALLLDDVDWTKAGLNDRATVYAYDALDRQTSVSRENFRYTNAQGQDVTGEAVVSRTTYDKLGRVDTQTDINGNVTAFEYNALGQLTKVTEPVRKVAIPQVATPDNPNSILAAIDPFLDQNKRDVTPVTTYTLDAFGQTVSQRRVAINIHGGAEVGSAITMSRTYDAGGNLTSAKDGNQNLTTYRVDYAGRLIEQSLAVNVSLGTLGTLAQTLKRRFFYDLVGHETDTLDVYTDASGALEQSGTHKDFNSFGEVIAESREWGDAGSAPDSLARAVVATYAYDKNGKQIQKTAGDGITKYYYDLAGDVTRQEQYALVLNTDGTVQLNPDGTAKIDTSVAARITEIGYDLAGYATIVRLPAMSAQRAGTTSDVLITPILQTTYDRWGNVTTRIQGGYVLNGTGGYQGNESRTCQYTYNANNQVLTEVSPTANATRADGSVYAAAVTHESHYNAAGQLVIERDVADDAGTPGVEAVKLRERRHEYDSLGELTADVDATNVRTEYAYDAFGNRIGTRNLGNGNATDAIVGTVFVDAYDANGNVTSHSILRSSTNTPYISGSGQSPLLYVLSVFEYDQVGRRVANADVMHDGFVAWTFTKYDERNLVTKQRNSSVVDTTYAYDQFGNRVLQLDGKQNGQTWSYRTDAFIVGQLKFTTVGTAYNSATGAFGTTNRVTTYAYSGFGQELSETYSGAVMTTAGINSRTYTYYENGLVKQVADSTAQGTAGAAGGADYWKSTNSTTYDYSVNGQQAQTTFTISSDYEDDLFNMISNPLSTRVTRMSYDARGRLIDVQAPSAQNAGHSSISDLAYRYDELDNRRRITATYQRIGEATASGSDKWYATDAEGRLTIVDGELVNGVIDARIAGATEVSYDALGRRYVATKFVGADSSDNHAPAGEVHEVASWTEYASQKYDYSDLGYLTKTWQAITRRDATVTQTLNNLSNTAHPPDAIGQWFLLEDRIVDVRGATTDDTIYRAVSSSIVDFGVDFAGTRASYAHSSYLGDGRLSTQETTQYGADGSAVVGWSFLTDNYDTAGILDNYVYKQGQHVNDPDFTNTFKYLYTMEFGGYREKTITVTSTSKSGQPTPQTGVTSNQFDSRGNLIGQIITNPGQVRSRALFYDNNGQIISKSESFTNRDSGQTGAGYQDFFYVNGHQVAVLGVNLLDAAQFINDFTPVTTSTGTMPGTYVVNAGDTLASIAQNLYGDAQLWYLIADANSVGFGPSQPLPATELGRTYRIPNAITDHSNATTFTPYNAGSIIGSSSPSPYLPPPPQPACGETGGLIAAAVIIVVATAVTIYTGGAASAALAVAFDAEASTAGAVVAAAVGAGIGAAAGNAAGQGAANLMGVQHGFDGNAVLAAGGSAMLGSLIGSGLALTNVADLRSEFVQRGARALGNYLGSALGGAPISGTGALYNFLTGTVDPNGIGQAPGFSLSNALTGVVANAFNPETGWVFNEDSRDWLHIATSVIQPFATQLGSWVASKIPLPIAASRPNDASAARAGARAIGAVAAGAQYIASSLSDAAHQFIDAASTAWDTAAEAAVAETAEPSPSIEDILGQKYTTTTADKYFELLGKKFYGDARLGTAIAIANGVDELHLKAGMELNIPRKEDLDLDAVYKAHLKEMVREQGIADQKLIAKGEVIVVNDYAPDHVFNPNPGHINVRLTTVYDGMNMGAETVDVDACNPLGNPIDPLGDNPAFNSALQALCPQADPYSPMITLNVTQTIKSSGQIRTQAGIADVADAKEFQRQFDFKNYALAGKPVPSNEQYLADLRSSYVGDHAARSALIEHNLDLTEGFAALGQTLAMGELIGGALAPATAAGLIAAPGLFARGLLGSFILPALSSSGGPDGGFGSVLQQAGGLLGATLKLSAAAEAAAAAPAVAAEVRALEGEVAGERLALSAAEGEGAGAGEVISNPKPPAAPGPMPSTEIKPDFPTNHDWADIERRQWRDLERSMSGEVANASDGMGRDFTVYRGSTFQAAGVDTEATVAEEFPEVPTAPQSPYSKGVTYNPRSGELIQGEFEIRNVPNPTVDGPPQAYVRFQHQTFDTLDDAMADAVKSFNPDSIRHGHELAGLPFITAEGRYGYSGPVVELENSANWSDPAKAIIHPEWGTRLPADWHTHGNYFSAVAIYKGQNPYLVPSDTAGEYLWRFPGKSKWETFNPNRFSGPDIQGAWALADDSGTQYTRYLGTPSGSMRWMTAQTSALNGRVAEGMMFPPGWAL